MKNENQTFVTYRTKATVYELYNIAVPKDVINKGENAIRDYIKKNDTQYGNFLETVEMTNRHIDDGNDAIVITD